MHLSLTRGHARAALSGAAMLVFFTLVWYFSVDHRWSNALGMGTMMGALVFGSQWRMWRR